MTIRETEARTGLDRATIRYYEKEGLLRPRRLENGYRDYSEADVTALLRVKLLRELGVSLEEIHALQTGEQTLSHALACRLEQLEQEQHANARAQETCRAIRSEGVSYGQLDPEKYLARTAAETPAVFRDTPPPGYCPWRRFFARMLDLELCTLLWYALLGLIFHVNLTQRSSLLRWTDGLIALGLMLLLEPFFLRRWGATPGKALFGLRLEHPDGRRITYGEGNSRTQQVIWWGMGMNIPIFQFIRLYKSYKSYTQTREMFWDTRQDLVLEAKPGSWRQNLAFLGAVAAGIALVAGIGLSSGFPPNRDGLTVAEFAENYNFLVDYYGLDTAYLLDAEGSWYDRSDGSFIYLGSYNAPPEPIIWETDGNGDLTALDCVWSYDQESILVEWPGAKMQLLSLAFAAGEGNWFQFWGKLGLLELVAQAEPFASFSGAVQGIDLTCTVEREGFAGSGGYLFVTEEDTAAHCRVSFALSS